MIRYGDEDSIGSIKELGVRARNTLAQHDLWSVGRVRRCHDCDLLEFKNMGETTLKRIRSVLGPWVPPEYEGQPQTLSTAEVYRLAADLLPTVIMARPEDVSIEDAAILAHGAAVRLIGVHKRWIASSIASSRSGLPPRNGDCGAGEKEI